MRTRKLRHRVLVLSPAEGGGYLVELVAYPHCQGWGRSERAALGKALKAYREWQRTLEAPETPSRDRIRPS